MAISFPDVGEDVPLLEGHRGTGTASALWTFGNVIISVLGTGVLGLPYAFKVSGWAVTSAAMLFCGYVSYYSMMLLVKCKIELADQEHPTISRSLGDLGNFTHGNIGRTVVDIVQLIAQIGSCISFFIFIGQNMSSIFTGTIQSYVIILSLLPFQVLLTWVRSLPKLAPFSTFATFCNILALALVIKDDVDNGLDFHKVKAYTNFRAMFFCFGVGLYCFEGIPMTFSLEASMRNPRRFGKVLVLAFSLIGLIYITFGYLGCLAYQEKTLDIITLNLPNDWLTIVVKVGLCIALFFTFPVMMIPVYEIFEGWIINWDQNSVLPRPNSQKYLSRGLHGVLVLTIGFVAIWVPEFGAFISVVGSTVCAMLALVLPAFFHMQIFKNNLSILQISVDLLLITCGVIFAIYGTYDALLDMYRSRE
ncbi:hypothetical protein O6H91_11G052800 [Diphasiastrum complanatum]|uniref:Uncharacterized protein n=1 Tax=Diphasiastrum complanatum TaxID=34168 RepID=A0ACC2C9I5_DIPCM|nr:hypothetical protein O6H91_11G052800 [Diphasiastrum complanatum]